MNWNVNARKVSALSRSLLPLRYYRCLHPIIRSRSTILTAAGLIYSTYRDVLGTDSDKPFPHSPIVGNQCHALVRQNISVQPRRNNIAVVSRNVV